MKSYPHLVSSTLALALLLAVVGCGHAAVPTPATTVSVAELGHLAARLEGLDTPPAIQAELRRLLPLRVDVRQGERLPIHLFLNGNVVELDTHGEQLELVAQRSFSILLRDDGPPLFSFDGTHFEDPDVFDGSVTIGYGVRPEGARLTLGSTIVVRE